MISYISCQGDPLQNLKQYYETIHKKDFDNYESHVQNQAVSSAIKSEHGDIHFEHDFLKCYMKTDIEKDLKSNGFFIRKNKNNRKNKILMIVLK